MCERQTAEGASTLVAAATLATLAALLISKNNIHNYYFSKRKLKVAFAALSP